MQMLNKGDKIAIVAPSGFIESESLQNGLNWFKRQGLEVVFMQNVFARYRYMGGSDEQRAADINQAFAGEDIKAIFCARGGAGAVKVLDKLDYELIKKNPKPIFGLSDSTALQNAVYAKTGNVSYTGFLPIYDFKTSDLDEVTAHSLLNVFNLAKQTVQEGTYLRGGKARGIMVGGCLSVLCSLCGSAYFPDLQNKILLLEDVGEKTYRLENMLTQLKYQKNFSKIKGIVFGKFTKCPEADEGDGTVEEIISDFVNDLNVPVISDFPYGHIHGRYVLPIGREVILDADKVQLEF